MAALQTDSRNAASPAIVRDGMGRLLRSMSHGEEARSVTRIYEAISFHVIVIVEGSGRWEKRTDSVAFQNSRAMDDSTGVGGMGMMGSDRTAVRRGSRLSLSLEHST